MSLPENFCSAPFIQLQTSKDNRCGPCPYTANLWQVQGTVADKWKSKELENLRTSFLENKQDTQCKRAWRRVGAVCHCYSATGRPTVDTCSLLAPNVRARTVGSRGISAVWGQCRRRTCHQAHSRRCRMQRGTARTVETQPL